MSPVKTNEGEFFIGYVDESPSEDTLIETIHLDEKNSGLSIAMDIDYLFESNFYFKIGGEYLTNSPVSSFELNLGLGYQMGSDKLRFRPGVNFAMGSAGVKLGDLYQNDVYIEVNGTQFYSDAVSIKLSRTHFNLEPNIELGLPVSDNLEIFGNLSYHLALSTGSNKLVFSGQDEAGQDVEAEESITAPNVYLSLNGNRVTSNFIDVDGIGFQIGIRYIVE